MHLEKVLAHQQRKENRHDRHYHARHEERDSIIAKPLKKLGSGLDRYHCGKHAESDIVEYPEAGAGNVANFWMDRSQPTRYQAGQKRSSARAQTYRNFTDPKAQQTDQRAKKNADANESYVTDVALTDGETNKFGNAFHIALGTTD